MDIVAFVLNTIIGAILVGGTIGFLMQQEPPTAAVFEGVPQEADPSPSKTLPPGPCPTTSSTCAGPSYVPPTSQP
jgi:hypothetical protein